MKKILFIFLFISTSCYAIDAISLYQGIKSNALRSKKVEIENWLQHQAHVLATRHNFYENVSYIGEEWDNVEFFCGFTKKQSKDIYNNSEVFVAVDWNQIINKTRSTKSYSLYLFANIVWKKGRCLYPRGAYAILRSGTELKSNDLYKKYSLSLFDVLMPVYVKNKIQYDL